MNLQQIRAGLSIVGMLVVASFAVGQWIATDRVRDGLEAQIAVIGTDLKHQNATLDVMQQGIKDNGLQLARLDAKVDALDARVGRLEVKVDALDDRVGRLENRMGRLEEQFNLQFSQNDPLAFNTDK